MQNVGTRAARNGISKNFLGKRVLVWGLGLHGGGVGTVRWLLGEGVRRIQITDLRAPDEIAPSIKEIERAVLRMPVKKRPVVRYVLGRHRKSDFRNADIIIKNPAIPPHDVWYRFARSLKKPLVSDIGIFFERSRSERIIGVTGTRGKSTTAYLIYKFLRAKFRRVFFGGNIRRSVFELLPYIRPRDFVVLELSSFQLHDFASEHKSPHVAVITNLFRDHIDWHGSERAYRESKRVIFKFQRPDDYIFISGDDPVISRFVRHAPSRIMRSFLPKHLKKIVARNIGAHYCGAVALAVAVARHFNVSAAHINRIIKKFNGLEGRQEMMLSARGVCFINDTTATIPDATIAAIYRFRPQAKRLILIAGGSDKKLRFLNLAKIIKRFVSVVVLLPGDATKKLAHALGGAGFPRKNIHYASSMDEGVGIACRMSRRGDTVLFSPGAASFGLFKNEFDRGEKFVRALKEGIKPGACP